MEIEKIIFLIIGIISLIGAFIWAWYLDKKDDEKKKIEEVKQHE